MALGDLQFQTPRLATPWCCDSRRDEGPRAGTIFLAHSAKDRSPLTISGDLLQHQVFAATLGFVGRVTASVATACTLVSQP